MKKHYLLIFSTFLVLTSYGQVRYLTVKSKDSINGQPEFKASLGANIKLNGYYDVYGGLQNSDTFNVGAIDVFGTDDSGKFEMDMYQTQIVFDTSIMTKNGKKIEAVVEFDFWGGNGQMRLRKAYVEFDHWQIGQNWASFGDEALWPNILEWEGPPSGVWVRSPHIKYFNTIAGNPDWRYIIALDAPITDYSRYGSIEPLLEEANQVMPDVILGTKYEKDWGHFRFATIFRNITYKLDSNNDNFLGYGFSFSGRVKARHHYFQYQLIAGKGITAYLTSVAGLGYDGFPTTGGGFDATPAYGGWASYEYHFTDKIHTNFVLGYTRFFTDDVERYVIIEDSLISDTVLNGDVNNVHGYGIVNMMYDPYERMTLGVELNYGVKKLEATGTTDNNTVFDIDKSRDAMRISFGLMFYF